MAKQVKLKLIARGEREVKLISFLGAISVKSIAQNGVSYEYQ